MLIVVGGVMEKECPLSFRIFKKFLNYTWKWKGIKNQRLFLQKHTIEHLLKIGVPIFFHESGRKEAGFCKSTHLVIAIG